MILDDTSERRMCCVDGQDYHADTPLGLYVVRGDSMVLMGEINEEGTAGTSKEISVEELEERLEAQAEKEERLVESEWDFDTDLIS